MLLILFFLLLIITALLTMKIRIDIKKFNITNIEKSSKLKKIKREQEIIVKIYIFNCVKIFSSNINKKVTSNLSKKMKPKLMKINKPIKEFGKSITIIKNIKLQFKDFKFNLNFGLEDINLLIYTFTLISSIIPFLIRNQWKNINYNIEPIYNMGNLIDLKLKGIVDINLVHIIYTGFMMKKKGMMKNGRKDRASNRKSYEYSNE